MSDADSRNMARGEPDLWTRVVSAGERLLVLDYDGTLAPFRRERMQAFPAEGAVEALRAVLDSGATRVAVMSGRPVHEIVELLGDLEVTVVGSHGAEFRLPGRDTVVLPLDDESRALLDRAEELASDAAAGGRASEAPTSGRATEADPVSMVERKLSSVALHTRGLDPELAQETENAVRDLWSDLTRGSDFECRDFDGGVEFRILGRDKGTALRSLLRDLPPDTLCVYLGDDETDEDAFAVVRSSGIGVRVGREERPTLATGRLDDPAAVVEFLRHWDRATAGK